MTAPSIIVNRDPTSNKAFSRHADKVQIQVLDKLFYVASLVPAHLNELLTTDETVLEPLDASSTGVLSAITRQDPE